jgi:hypothetical protein
MDKALDVIGQRIYVASNGGCTDSCDYRGGEDIISQTNASRNVGSHLKQC